VGLIEKTVAGADKLYVKTGEELMATGKVSKEGVSVKAGMSPKATSPRDVTELGIVIEVSPVFEKA
jgi:hypothetical protein